MTDLPHNLQTHRLLVANRGEIALRILRTAKDLKVRTVAIYTPADATAPHVLFADEAVALSSFIDTPSGTSQVDVTTNARGYLDIDALLKICTTHGITLVHPGYGFLSENAGFARRLADKGICLLGPDAQLIEDMGLKHKARALAIQAEVPVVPGSEGLVEDVQDAERVAGRIGYPVMIKATAGGGGMGLVVCRDVEELRSKLSTTQSRAQSLFHNGDVFIEKYFDSSRHIEVQIFGNGCGHVIHMGERECSVQRRHQKVLEEAPSPYLANRLELRTQICNAAVRLGTLINYKSAGTVEFLVDDASGSFYFLEMNTRLQVEHGVTEALHPGLDIVSMMIMQGVYERSSAEGERTTRGIPTTTLDQRKYENPSPDVSAVEARIYCENPANDFSPSPGLLQHVELPGSVPGVRVDSWVSTGMSVTPYYDPLLAKVIVWDSSREAAIAKLAGILVPDELVSEHDAVKRVRISGPPTNIPFLHQALKEEVFIKGKATTQWLDEGGVNYTPSAFTVVSPGINATVQSLPARDIGLGIPPSGPMDPLAFQAGNAIVGNALECEGLELVIPPRHGSGGAFSAIFHTKALIAVVGAPAHVSVDGKDCQTWSRLEVPAGVKVVIGGPKADADAALPSGGLRAYLLVAGGFPGIPTYLGSKSTSLGIGGYQGRALHSGDLLQIRQYDTLTESHAPIPRALIPTYPSHWTLSSLPGPHDDTEFLTASGIESFYGRKWKVAPASNRMGIRLEPADSEATEGPLIEWARKDGAEGGSHPSNILDNGYARGSVNLNGDTPVILTNEGPSMGGYLCVATIATADQWKLGQLRPGDTIQFHRISIEESRKLKDHTEKWLDTLLALSSGFNAAPMDLLAFRPEGQFKCGPKLHVIPATSHKPKAVFRQAGDSAILVEYGEMTLDLFVRARIQAFEDAVRGMQISGIKELAPCIRSTMVHYDNELVSQEEILQGLILAETSLPAASEDMTFTGRKIIFPIVLDDRWNREALERYMRSTRDKAVYLPSNIEYLANNNGIEGGSQEALSLLVSSPWLVLGVGFYLACPFLVPIDPRARLVGQKMNPSRTFTPSGAVGIAGVVAAIYPVESPGGYQLFGRTLPTWQAWGSGTDFTPDRPWLLRPFDQVVFEPIETIDFSMSEYMLTVKGLQAEIDTFIARRGEAVKREEAREALLLKEWQDSKKQGISSSTMSEDQEETPNFVTASLPGTVWRMKVEPGDIIQASDQVVAILEAMKTEINITAGEDNVDLKVVSIANGAREGKAVQTGDKLVFFA
ncbi:hypothetical protein EIP91_012306 [Steccherinum ochraceum]|uniref:Urea carboxylase n=1 Tax=Steccherinum ochraceum TaxID=92696 RepID=A0A4R0RGU8_9APHY|nr:hypothetical protein EIP91_012306 [Steccherinum ochraceum]